MIYGMGVVKGMLLTLKHVFRPAITVNYPEQQREVPARARTNLLWFEERCTGCSTCAQACPDGCILVETSMIFSLVNIFFIFVDIFYDICSTRGSVCDSHYHFSRRFRISKIHQLAQIFSENSGFFKKCFDFQELSRISCNPGKIP